MMPLFADQEATFIRLLEASCLLSDLSWFEHEDYQAQHAFERVLVLPLYGVDHPGRVFLALSQYVRYRGFLPTHETAVTTLAKQILPPIDIEVAVIVGLAQRIGYMLTGGALALLKQSEIKIVDESITLTLRGRARLLDAESIAEAMTDLATAMGRQAEIIVED
jgi:exopolyphosphatase/guanosine-5'-triphosphate,3'-diphosphate pyrophosphatase